MLFPIWVDKIRIVLVVQSRVARIRHVRENLSHQAFRMPLLSRSCKQHLLMVPKTILVRIVSGTKKNLVGLYPTHTHTHIHTHTHTHTHTKTKTGRTVSDT